MPSQTLLISQLQRGRTDKNFVVRVTRMWKCYNTKKDREVISMDLLAVDEKLAAIQVTIRSKFIPDFDGLFKEGCFYTIKNFSVAYRKAEYRVVDRESCVLLDASTYVEPLVESVPKIPRYMFNLVPFDNLLDFSQDKKNLCDVIGYVVAVSDVVERMSNFKPVSLQLIELKDNSGASITIALWGDSTISEATSVQTSLQRVWIVNSTIVKLDNNGNMLISSSSSTKFYNDSSIEEICAFIETYKPDDGDEEIRKIPLTSNVVTKEEYQKYKKIIPDIKEMLANCYLLKDPIFVYGSISDIHQANGWRYNACPRCNKKIHSNQEKMHCGKCHKDVSYVNVNFRLEVVLHDGHDTLNCILFDKEVERLLKMTAVNLNQIVEEEGLKEPTPRQIRALIGKIHIFQLQFNEDSRGSYNENFTVKRVLSEDDIHNQTDDKNVANPGGLPSPPPNLKTPSPYEKKNNMRMSGKGGLNNRMESGGASGSISQGVEENSKKPRRNLGF